MKKMIFTAAAVVAAALTLSACGSGNGAEGTQTDNTMETEQAQETTTYSAGEYDLDTTNQSATIAYSNVYDMMVNPDNYLGKKIRVKGTFNYCELEGIKYYACVIKDATECCSQGIEFVLKDQSLQYPDDYPEANAPIVVSGIFDTYEEDGVLYCRLLDAQLE